MYRIAICDDVQQICHYIEKILLNFAKSENLKIDIEIFYDGKDLCRFIRNEHDFDLIYLDIEMNGLDGIAASKEIRNTMQDLHTDFIFVSGTDTYYRALFDVQPLHFIHKPIHPEEVTADLLLSMKRKNILKPCFYFKNGKTACRLPFSDILYFESDSRKIKIATKTEAYTYYEKFNLLETRLPDTFSRIHRCYIVNRHQIRQYSADEVILGNNERLPLSKTYRQRFLEQQLHDMDEETYE